MNYKWLLIIFFLLTGCAKPFTLMRYSDIVPLPVPPNMVYAQDQIIHFSIEEAILAQNEILVQAVTKNGDRISGRLFRTTEESIFIDRSAVPQNVSSQEDLHIGLEKSNTLILRIW